MGPVQKTQTTSGSHQFDQSASRQTIRKAQSWPLLAAPMWVMPNHDLATAIKAPRN